MFSKYFFTLFYSTTVIENCSTANFKVEIAEENVAGVKLPVFRRYGDTSSKDDDSKMEGMCFYFFYFFFVL